MAEEDRLDSVLSARPEAAPGLAADQGGKTRDNGARTLLRTKLQRPVLPANTVDRPRLVGPLKRVLDLPVTLVSAPIGFGKSTLVAQALADVTAPVAWLSLDEYDNDLQLFLDYLIAAIQVQLPNAGVQTQRLLHDFGMPSAETLAVSLLNELQAVATPLIVVLDDFHHLTDPRIHQFFATWLRSLPSDLHLVVLTQTDPPWPLARLVARGQLQEVRAADLRFRLDEAATFLATVPGLSLAPDDVKLLVTQTEGWIAVLRLAIMAFRGEPDVRRGLSHLVAQDHLFAGRFLVQEVLARQPAEIRDFLLRTAILDRLSAPLCAALVVDGTGAASDGPTAQTIDAWLRNPNLFIVPLDAEGRWYRYHLLFRRLLGSELAAQWDSESIADLHHRASQWYADRGFVEDAVRHSLAAGEMEGAAALVESQVHARLNCEDWQGVERCLAVLPEDLTRRRPRLLLAQAWVATLRFERRSLVTLLAATEAQLAEPDGALTEAGQAAARAEIAAFKGMLAWWNDGSISACLQHSQVAWQTLPPECSYARSVALHHMGAALYAGGRPAEASRLLWGVVDALDEPATVKARALISLATFHRVAGPAREFERIVNALLALAESYALPLSVAWAHHFLGSLHYERNELDQAIAHFRGVIESPQPAHFLCLRDSLIETALAYQAQGRSDEADATVAGLTQRSRAAVTVQEASSLALQVRLALARGDTDDALRLATDLPEDLPVWKSVLTEIPAITRAQALLAANGERERQAALKLLDALETAAAEVDARRPLVKILALEAIGLTAEGRHGEAMVKVERAVRLAEPMGLIRTLVDVGPALAPLLRTLRECGVASGYLKRVLATLPRETPSTAKPGLQSHEEELIEPLTNREIEVLLLLAQRLSNKEIAERLFISTLTVKRHTSRLLGKLDARNRREAVQRAQALGLLPPP